MLDLIIILSLVVFNGVLAMAELALVSARKARLQQRVFTGDRGAQAALDLAATPNRFLSTVQIGITLVGVLAGAFGGSRLAQDLAPLLAAVPGLAPYAEPVAFGVVVLLVSYLSLVLGELVPKRLALQAPEAIAAFSARPMGALARVVSPAVWFLSKSTDVVLRLFGSRPRDEPAVTEEEIRLLLEQGAQSGLFEPSTQELFEGVIEAGDVRASELMTPRLAVVGWDVEGPIEENLQRIAESGHTYFPVYEGGLDRVLGIATIRDFWERSLHGEPLEITDVLRQPLFVPEAMSALRVLEQFKATGIHTALVTDEYGGIEGLVTLTDVMEAIVGDVSPPEPGETEPVVRRADGSLLVDGMVGVDELKELLGVRELPAEERGYYQTLGGFIMMHLRRVPAAADWFEWGGFKFEVVDLDGRRVDKVLISPIAAKEEDAPTTQR